MLLKRYSNTCLTNCRILILRKMKSHELRSSQIFWGRLKPIKKLKCRARGIMNHGEVRETDLPKMIMLW